MMHKRGLPSLSILVSFTVLLLFMAVQHLSPTRLYAQEEQGENNATATLTPWLVTATPTPKDVFEAATRIAQLTAVATMTGTATALPTNMLLATNTPKAVVVTATPTAENSATAAIMVAQETAIAFTTGTPNPNVQVAATATPSPTAWVVTATPTPENVLAAATIAAQKTAEAPIYGTATATPRNMVLATNTPRPIVVTSTPLPDNAATASAMLAKETAIAFTTGTAVTAYYVTATPMPRPPRPAQAGVVPPANTPVSIAAAAWTPIPVKTLAPFAVELVGKILFLGENDSASGGPEVYVIDANRGGLGRLTSREFYERAVAREARSPDGQTYAFAEHDPGSGRTQIFTIANGAASPTLLTRFGDGVAWSPAWSPREERIAFVSSDGGNDEIWVVFRGEWPAQRLTQNEWQWDKHPSWSPDGREIIFMSNRNGKRQLWIMDASGANQRVFADLPFEAWDPVWVKYRD